MATTNDAMFENLSKSYPSAGQTLGDLLYAFAQDKGFDYRGTVAYDWLVGQGATGTTVGDLGNNFFSVVYDTVIFDISDPDEWLELQVFDRYDTVEQEIYLPVW